MIKQIIIGIIGIAFGFVLLWKNVYIVDHLTGRNAWAEKTFGGAGTYTLIKLLGILMIFLFLLYGTGLIGRLVDGFLGLIFGTMKSV
jgi:hypothetical protein